MENFLLYTRCTHTYRPLDLLHPVLYVPWQSRKSYLTRLVTLGLMLFLNYYILIYGDHVPLFPHKDINTLLQLLMTIVDTHGFSLWGLNLKLHLASSLSLLWLKINLIVLLSAWGLTMDQSLIWFPIFSLKGLYTKNHVWKPPNKMGWSNANTNTS